MLFILSSVVVTIDCKNACKEPDDDVREVEEKIVRSLKEDRSSNASEKVNKINEVISEQVHEGVSLADLQIGHSIRCYLLCRSPAALQSLHQKTLHRKTEHATLTTTMQSVFNILLGRENSVEVVKTRGHLTQAELRRKVEIFSKDLGKQVL